MKKIITIMMVLAMVVALAVPALAVEGVTTDEQALYNHFCDVVDEWVAKKPEYKDRANQYKDMALQTLINADLDSAACADLDSTINSVASDLTNANPTTVEEMKAILPSIVSKVNDTSKKYDIVVAVSEGSGYGQTYVGGKAVVVPADGPAPIKDSSTGKDNTKPSNPIIKQTGFDMTGTIVVAAVLAIALLGSAVVISKKRLASNH